MSDYQKTQGKSMLHEILAVEADRSGMANRIIPETIHTFKDKAAHFQSAARTLKLFEDKGDQTTASEQAEAQFVEMVTTVAEKLKYTLGQIGQYYDVVLQKEATNQHAKADIVLPNGQVFLANVPATFLLGLETKLKTLRTVYEAIPTLAPGIKWELDPAAGPNVWRQVEPEVRAKTAKEIKHKVLVQASDKFPAQIEKWEETTNVGVFTKQSWSSCMTTTDKSVLLGRIDDLIQATKQARQRANTATVVNTRISDVLSSYLHTGII